MTARLPSLNGLRAFEAAARHLSFTLAATELNVTQTAISHQIRRLEEELGIRLFIRQNRALALTPEARDYLPGSAPPSTTSPRHRPPAAQGRRQGADPLDAGLAAAKWLLPRLTDFQEQHPGIDVRITTSTSLVDFQRDDVDAAIRYGRGQWPGLRGRLADGGRVVSGVQSVALRGDKPLQRPEDLRNHPLLHTSNANSDDWRLWLTAAGLPADSRQDSPASPST
jgi:LysR family glycine cleavage system transcriptional activator